MENALIEQIVNEVMKSLENDKKKESDASGCSNVKPDCKMTVNDYPLAQKRTELVNTKSGKNIKDITIENVLNGSVTADDIKITSDVLLYQAEISESIGRVQFAKNLRRAAELTVVPDDRVLEIYNSLRPYRSTKEELMKIAEELENKYNAKINAALVRDAAAVYEKRDRLKR